VPNATLHSTGGTGGANDTSPFSADVILTSGTSEERTVVYTEPGGQVVVVHYAAVGGNPYGAAGCIVKGLAEKL
jgi:20S proteasome alpha/beta subunit